MNAIEVRNLVKRFGTKTVVDHVTMNVAEGEIVGFLGPNGSGKTTTIRIMCGLLTPDEGEGRVLGYDLLTESLKIKREVGYMTQRFSFYEDLTIAENLEFVARLYQLKPLSEHVDRTLDELGLTSRRDQEAGPVQLEEVDDRPAGLAGLAAPDLQHPRTHHRDAQAGDTAYGRIEDPLGEPVRCDVALVCHVLGCSRCRWGTEAQSAPIRTRAVRRPIGGFELTLALAGGITLD